MLLFPCCAGMRLGAGLIDARSVWKDDLPAAAAVLSELTSLGISDISIQPSTSLQHLPFDTSTELGHLGAELVDKLAFAVQKLAAVATLASGAVSPAGAAAAQKWGLPPDAPTGGNDKATTDSAVAKNGIRSTLPGVDAALLARCQPYSDRRLEQHQFHAFPTSTIGSFPQTAEVGCVSVCVCVCPHCDLLFNMQAASPIHACCFKKLGMARGKGLVQPRLWLHF
jgi:5-methyltetrahydropteroyltriglutamate--homocysteine methyltransferase